MFPPSCELLQFFLVYIFFLKHPFSIRFLFCLIFFLIPLRCFEILLCGRVSQQQNSWRLQNAAVQVCPLLMESRTRQLSHAYGREQRCILNIHQNLSNPIDKTETHRHTHSVACKDDEENVGIHQAHGSLDLWEFSYALLCSTLNTSWLCDVHHS